MEEEPGGLQPMGQEESDVTGHACMLESRVTHASFPPHIQLISQIFIEC